MASNPNPSRITAASWWLMEQLLVLQPGTKNGGIYAAKSGYHNTRNGNPASNYSVREAEDKGGPGDKAAAYDWTFSDAQAARFGTIARYHSRLMEAGRARDPRLSGWREAYGQEDSDRQVEGYDFRHHYPVTSDTSHLWHIHLSEDRNKVDSFENKDALLSVLKGESLAGYLERTGVKPAPPSTDSSVETGHDPGTRVLKLTDPQMSGEDVRFVQRFLGPDWAGPADGIFGPQTKAGVEKYQRMRGLEVDGEVGPNTFANMGIKWRG